MSKAIGMVEYKTVSQGMFATDRMLKTAEIELVEAQTVCPGKYIAIICGEHKTNFVHVGGDHDPQTLLFGSQPRDQHIAQGVDLHLAGIRADLLQHDRPYFPLISGYRARITQPLEQLELLFANFRSLISHLCFICHVMCS